MVHTISGHHLPMMPATPVVLLALPYVLGERKAIKGKNGTGKGKRFGLPAYYYNQRIMKAEEARESCKDRYVCGLIFYATGKTLDTYLLTINFKSPRD